MASQPEVRSTTSLRDSIDPRASLTPISATKSGRLGLGNPITVESETRMAQKYRCPVCGATHKDLPEKCRLCGQMMGPDAAVGDRYESQAEVVERRGIGAIVGVVLLLVIAIVAVAVLVGAVPGTKVLDSLRSKIGVNPTPDGWSRFDYPEGGFSVEFPEGTREMQIVDGRYEADMTIPKDVYLRVAARPIMTKEEFAELTNTTDGLTNLKRALTSEGDGYEQGLKSEMVKVDKRAEAGALGLPSIYYETRNLKAPPNAELREGATLYGREMLFMKGGVLYLVEVVSVYPDMAQFDRVLGSLQINARPGQSTGTTTAP